MAKYDSLRKLDRNQYLKEYAESHPHLSLKQIGQIFNIDASRVCRILNGKPQYKKVGNKEAQEKAIQI